VGAAHPSRRWAGLGWAGLGCTAKSGESSGEVNQAVVQDFVISVRAPKGVAATKPVILATTSLSLTPQSSVALPPSAPAPVVALGAAAQSVVGPDAKVGELWSRGPVDLRDRVTVQGKLHAAVVTLGNQVTVSGGFDRAPVFDPLNEVSWKVQWPTGAGPLVSLQPGATSAISPGLFGSVHVASGARLTLSSGTYYLSELVLEPQSVIELNQAAGPVTVYSAQRLIYRGTTVVTGGGTPDWLVGVLGQEDTVIEAAFTGALLVPNARLTLRGPGSPTLFTGFFFGKSVEVSPLVTVRYQAPNVILGAAGLGVGQCAALVAPRSDLTGQDQEIAFQRDIARYCSMVGATPTQIDIAARTNVDYAALAFSLAAEAITPARYLAVVRDRVRKERAAEDNATQADLISKTPDGDRDLVPDSQDACPDTPPLTATFDNGCTDPSVPDAPSASDVSRVLAHGGIAIDPRCSGAHPLPDAVAGAFYYPRKPERGTYILAGRVLNQPPACPIWYAFDIEATSPSGVVQVYPVVFAQQESATSLVGLGKPVPRGFIQFNPLPGDPGTRGVLGSAGGKGSVRFRVRTMNGGGMHSGWSEWKTTTQADCFALGFKCGQ